LARSSFSIRLPISYSRRKARANMPSLSGPSGPGLTVTLIRLRGISGNAPKFGETFLERLRRTLEKKPECFVPIQGACIFLDNPPLGIGVDYPQRGASTLNAPRAVR
jgi:hypothetical protein